MTVLAILMLGFQANAQYCTAGPSSTADSEIRRVRLIGNGDSINNPIACPAVTGQRDFTTQSVSLLQGTTYQISIEIGTCGGIYNNWAQAWIDYNGNQTFDATESIGSVGPVSPTLTTTFTFTVPATATIGSTRLRVRQQESGTLPLNPCGTFTYGSQHDYTVVIGAAPACAQPTAPLATNITSSGATIGFTENGTATAWQVAYGLAGTSLANATVVAATSNPYALTGLVANTNYVYWVRSNCGGTFSPWSPSGSFTTLCSSQLSGTVTINQNAPASATNYVSFSALANELNACGMSGALTVNVVAGSGPYDGRLVLNQIVGASAVNTITINGNNNLLTWDALISDQRATVLLNGADYININNLKIEGRSQAQAFGIQFIGGADYNNITNCEVMLNAALSSSTIAGIVMSGSLTSATTAGNTGNYNTITNTKITGGYYGATLMGTSTTVYGQSNKFIGCTMEDFYLYGIYFANQEDAQLSGNNINRQTRTSISISTFNGVYFFGTNPGTIINANRIHDNVTLSPTNTSTTYGIYSSSGIGTVAKPMRIQNNAIYNIKGNGTTYAIYLSSNTYTQVYHNTILLDNAAQTGTSTIAGIYHTAVGTGVDIKNNIIRINNGSTGTKYLLWFSNTAPVITSDNNNLSYGIAGGVTVTARRGTTNSNTLMDWQMSNSNFYDQASTDADPLLANPSGGNLAPTSGAVNNLGAALGVLTDLTGATRSATAPDMGAVEFVPPTCPPPTNLTAVVTNLTASLGWTEAGTATSWNIEYGPQGFTPGLGTTVTASSNPYVLTGLTALTTYSYYVRASCSVTDQSYWVGPFSFTSACAAAMSGAYTVDKNAPASATNFTSFTALAANLNGCGISGPVTVNVVANSGPYDERFALVQINGASVTNTITINGNNNLLTYNSANTFDRASLLLDGTDYLTVNNLKIEGRSTSFAHGIHLLNGADYNTINNCEVLMPITSTSAVSGIVMSSSLTSSTSSGNNGNYNTISNTKVVGGYYGATMMGTSSTVFGMSNKLQNCTFENFYVYGVYFAYQEDGEISGCDLNRATMPAGNISTFYGLYFFSVNPGFLISANKIHDNATTNPPAAITSYPIYSSAGLGTALKPIRIYNNAIYNIKGDGIQYAVYLTSTSDYYEVYHNSINLDNAAQTGTSAIAGIYHTGTATGVHLRNNIVYINNGSTGTKYLIWFSNTAPAFTSNYNDLSFGSAGGATITARRGTTNSATLMDWQMSNGSIYDQNSVDLNPVFASPGQGVMQPLNAGINNLGTPVGVLTDLSGATRSLTTPDLGALEFTGLPSDVALISGQLVRGQCYSTNDSVKFTITNVIGGTLDFSTSPVIATWNVTGPTNSNGTITVNTGTLAPGASLVLKGAGVSMPSSGTYILNGSINSSAFNLSASNDVLSPVSLFVGKLLVAVPTTATVNNSLDTVNLQAFSPYFPNGGFFISEIAHFKTTTGQPVGGWPAYLTADDYIEITGSPYSDLGGITLEQWSATALSTTYTFPAGTILGPNGTAIIAVGQLGSSVPVPSSYYYHGIPAGNTISFSSTTGAGRILKFGSTILDAVGYATYTFPVAAGVTATDWSGNTPATGNSGNRLTGADNNTSSNWVNSSTSPQDPNVVNSGVTVPTAPPVTGFNWTYMGSSVSTSTSYWAGPFAANGTYKYVAAYNSTQCGMIYDTTTIVVDLPCVFTVDLLDSYGDGWNGALVSFEVNNVEVGVVGSTFTSGSSATETIGFFDQSSVVMKLKAAGSYPEEVGFTVKNPQGIVLYTHTPTTGLTTGHIFTTKTAVCNVPTCPITDVPAVAAQTSCGPVPVTFTATGNTIPNKQDYFWMRSSDSAVIAMGGTFTTPPITAPASWLVGIGAINDAVARQHVGPAVVGTTGGYGNFTNGMFFTAQDFFFLDSMTVRANGPMSFIIRISEPLLTPAPGGAGAQIVTSDTIVIAAAGDHKVYVGMAVSPGSYFMNMSVIPGSGTGALWRTTGGQVFPYSIPGLVSITGPNFATARYYYFYDWVVSRVCVSSFATASATFAPVPSTALPYAESFNTSLPCNWSVNGVGAEWTQMASFNGSSLNSTGFMMVNDDAVGSGTLTQASMVSPSFNVIGYDSLWIEFDHYYRHLTGTSGKVEVWNGSQWVVVYTASATTGAWSAPNHQMIDITAHQNPDLQVRFRYDDGNAWGWYWSVDNFELDGVLSPCQNVVVNLVTDIYGSEASWSIIDTTSGFVYASGGPYADVSPYNAALATHIDTVCLPTGQYFEFRMEDSYGDGLFDGTNTGTFNAYIICPWGNNTILTGGGASAYGSATNPPSYDSTVFELTCLIPCSAPDSLAAVEACTSASLSWSSEANATSTIQWGAAGFTLGTGTKVNNATSPVVVTGLLPGTNYSFYVLDTCFSSTTSAWVGPFNFTTDIIPAPTALAATPGCTVADLIWTSTASTSTIQWGVTGFTPGTGTFINGATSPEVISGLALGTTYDFWVQDSCGGAAGAWAGPFTFTTQTLPVITATANLVSSGSTVTYDFTATGAALIYGWDFGDGTQDTGMAVTHIYVANGTYTVILAAYNNCGVSYDTISVIVQGIGIDEFGIGDISLYPNPNDGYFTISGLTNFGSNAKIEVLNMTGAIIYSKPIIANSSETFVLDLRGYAPGVYQVRVSSEKGVGVKPFVLRN